MIALYDIVRLKKPIPAKKLEADTKGAVLIIYDEPNLPLAYEVEFVDKDGKTLAVVTLKDEDVEKV